MLVVVAATGDDLLGGHLEVVVFGVEVRSVRVAFSVAGGQRHHGVIVVAHIIVVARVRPGGVVALMDALVPHQLVRAVEFVGNAIDTLDELVHIGRMSVVGILVLAIESIDRADHWRGREGRLSWDCNIGGHGRQREDIGTNIVD